MENNTTNTPLTAGEQIALFFFILFYILACRLLFGIIPAIILIFGVIFLKKNNDFTSITTSVKIVQGIAILVMAVSVLSAAYYGYEYYDISTYHYDSVAGWLLSKNQFLIPLYIAGIALFYYAINNYMFYDILVKHQTWVEQNRIFSKQPKTTKEQNSTFYVIKGEKLKQFSVADELLKWAKLKEDGHISEEEFTEMRNKLLQKKD